MHLDKAVTLIGFCVAVAVAAGPAFAECGPRPVNACELANNDDEIFVARALAHLPDDPFTWRVHVVRNYRGAAAGDILVRAFTHYDLPAPAELEAGKSYLFYTSQREDDGAMIRTTPMACSTWLPVSAVGRAELTFLANLSSRTVDGRILGTLVRPLPGFKQEPVTGVAMQASGGGKSYSATTDAEGRFDIRGLPAGFYRVKALLPDNLRIEGDTDVQIVAHGCVDEYFTTAANTSISGRVVLPLGVQVTGTQVTVLRTDGRDVKSTFTDPFGRYFISGLDPGDYIVGVNAGQYAPRVAAPYLPTFAPGTSERPNARVIHIGGPAEFNDVNITVTRLADVVKIAVHATFEDGRPVPEQSIGLSPNGYGEYDIRRTTSADGVAMVSVVRGSPVWVLGSAPTACMPPLRLGPDNYPDRIDVVYTPDGCREQSNRTSLGVLQTSARGPAATVRFRVTYPDGTPAYKANVGIVSVTGRGPYAMGFLTDKDGVLDLPVPLNSEFTIDAGPPDGMRNCTRTTTLLFNTDRGIRWQARADRSAQPNWDDVPQSSGVVPLALGGAACKP